MGGRKKLTLKQMEKQQLLRQMREQKRGKVQVKVEEKKEPALFIDEATFNEIKKEALTANLITPYMIASKYNVKISTAKRILRHLEAEGIVKLVSRSRRTLIYMGAQARREPPPEPMFHFLPP